MTEDIKGRVFNYLNCGCGDMHEGEQLNLVCLEGTCKEIGLICPVCRSQKHQKHKVVPLKIFLSEISGIADMFLNGKQNQNSLDGLLNQVDGVYSKLLVNLKDIVQKMAMQIKQLEEQIHVSHKNQRQRLLEQNQTQMNFPQVFQQILNSQYKNVDQMKQDVKRIIDNVNYNQGKIEIEFRPQKVFDFFQKTSNEVTTQLSQLFTQFKTQIGKVGKPLEKISQPLIQTQYGPYMFSQTLKSPSITIVDGKFAMQTVSQNYDNRFALIEPPLSESSKIVFKILAHSHFIGVGITLKGVLQTKKLKFDYNNLGHGSYMVSSNGYSWSHSSKDQNIQGKSFKFQQGDVIVCEYIPEQKLVKFTKKSTPIENYSLNLEIPENEEVHFCVNLCSINEKVEICEDEIVI